MQHPVIFRKRELEPADRFKGGKPWNDQCMIILDVKRVLLKVILEMQKVTYGMLTAEPGRQHGLIIIILFGCMYVLYIVSVIYYKQSIIIYCVSDKL